MEDLEDNYEEDFEEDEEVMKVLSHPVSISSSMNPIITSKSGSQNSVLPSSSLSSASGVATGVVQTFLNISHVPSEVRKLPKSMDHEKSKEIERMSNERYFHFHGRISR